MQVCDIGGVAGEWPPSGILCLATTNITALPPCNPQCIFNNNNKSYFGKYSCSCYCSSFHAVILKFTSTSSTTDQPNALPNVLFFCSAQRHSSTTQQSLWITSIVPTLANMLIWSSQREQMRILFWREAKHFFAVHCTLHPRLYIALLTRGCILYRRAPLQFSLHPPQTPCHAFTSTCRMICVWERLPAHSSTARLKR